MTRPIEELLAELETAIVSLKAQKEIEHGQFMYYLNLKCPHCGGSHNTGHDGL